MQTVPVPAGPLRRMGSALAALPPPSLVGVGAGPPIDPGPWCWHVPLWGNPLLRVEAGGLVEALSGRHGMLASVPSLCTMGDLAALRE